MSFAGRVPRSATRFYWPVWGWAAVTAAVYAVYALSRQATLLTAGYDLGIFDQAVRDYARWRAPIVPVKGGQYNIFADHFHPIIALAAPLYWIWDSPSTLLVLQAVLIGLSVPVVHGFAARWIGARPALVVAIAYAAGWPLQAMVDFDFHEVAFGVPLVAVAVDALDRGDDRVLLVGGALLLLVREDMGAVLVMLGLIRLLRRPRWQWPGVALIGAGVATYLIVTSLVIPHFAPDGFSYWTFDSLGPDLPHAVGHVIIHPIDTVHHAFTPSVKAQTLAYLFGPLLLIPLRSRYAWVALPLLAERFFNSRDYLWTTHYHYSAMAWVILVMAMVDGAQRLGLWSRRRIQAAVLAYLLAVPLVLLVRPGVTPSPLRRMITGAAFHSSRHIHDAHVVLAQIPRDVCVSADDRLVPQLTYRNRVSEPGLSSPKTDFVVLDMSQHDVGYLQPSPVVVRALWLSRGYSVVSQRGDFQVLRSPTYTGPSSSCHP